MAVLHGWRYCPRCSAELETGRGRVECPACGFVAWANPAPTACALVVDDRGRLLLGRRAHEPFAGDWDTPGGFVEEGEHPLEALRRELREETGLEIEPGDFLGAWMDVYGDGPDAASTLNLYWEARPLTDQLRPADDIAELAWFERDELPAPEETAFTNVADVLRAWSARDSG